MTKPTVFATPSGAALISTASPPSSQPPSPPPSPAIATTIMDITPPELKAETWYSMTVSQDSVPTIYLAGSNNLIRFKEGHKPELIPVKDPMREIRLLGDRLYYLSPNCVKSFSLQDQQTSLLAGTCGNDYGYRDGPSSQTVFNYPEGLAVDQNGTVYVADTQNHQIRKIANRTVSKYAGNWIATIHPTKGLNFFCIAGICSAGSLTDEIDHIDYFISGKSGEEPSRAYIQATDLTNSQKPGWTLPIVQDGVPDKSTFWHPFALELDPEGNLYVADRIAIQQHIRQVTPQGEVSTLIANINPSIEPSNPNTGEYFGYPQARYTQQSLLALQPTSEKSDLTEGIETMALSQQTLYVLGNNLYALDLVSHSWKIAIPEKVLNSYLDYSSGGIGHRFTVKDLAADKIGTLYLAISNGKGGQSKVLKITPKLIEQR